MKAMKRNFLALVCLVLSTVGCMAGDEVSITVKELPQAAQTTISTTFKALKVSEVTKERDGLGFDYEVRFTNGTKVEFDRKGEWKDVDCGREAVPAEFVPKQIRDYVKKNHPQQRIVQIERDRHGYDIELSDGTEIDFNTKFKVTKIDR